MVVMRGTPGAAPEASGSSMPRRLKNSKTFFAARVPVPPTPAPLLASSQVPTRLLPPGHTPVRSGFPSAVRGAADTWSARRVWSPLREMRWRWRTRPVCAVAASLMVTSRFPSSAIEHVRRIAFEFPIGDLAVFILDVQVEIAAGVGPLAAGQTNRLVSSAIHLRVGRPPKTDGMPHM
jgi:hypothetical protein